MNALVARCKCATVLWYWLLLALALGCYAHCARRTNGIIISLMKSLKEMVLTTV